jgi:formylmethanofuran dehydrogenase subunit C
MRGGLIRVRGSAGDLVGAARPGQAVGMREGTILIEGDAGDDVGLAMRRGLVAVGGRCGRRAARGIVAGSVMAFGGVGPDAALGMKRGTLLVGEGSNRPEDWPTFRRACRYRPAFVAVYLRHLESIGFRVPEAVHGASFERYFGVFLDLGHGEVLVRADG